MALFTPMGDHNHRANAIAAAHELMRRAPEVLPPGQVPGLGIGVNAGTSYIGRVGVDADANFTALGDTVNVAARLQGLAKPGEIILGEDLWQSERSSLPPTEQRDVEIRGREEPMTIAVITADPDPSPASTQ